MLRSIDLHGDVIIDTEIHWKGGHYRINGNLRLREGGRLIAEDCVLELTCAYSRQFDYIWEGGALVTRNTTIGGTISEGVIRQADFMLTDGEWESEDTTVRYVYGMVVGDDTHTGKVRAKRLRGGVNPDSVIMSGLGDVILEDSEYLISLSARAEGGVWTYDFPINTPVSAVFDSSNIPGAKYRLELINTSVPFWFFFIHDVSMDGPPTEIVLNDCPMLIACMLGSDWKGTFTLPPGWPAEGKSYQSVTLGNLTWRTLDKPVSIPTWGIYTSGRDTDVTFLWPHLHMRTLCR